jgi:uncharacterized protein (DUF885 family)
VLATTLGVRDHDRELGDLTLADGPPRARGRAFVARLDRVDTAGPRAGERVDRGRCAGRRSPRQVEGEPVRASARCCSPRTTAGTPASPTSRPATRSAARPTTRVRRRLLAFPAYNRGAVATTRAALAGGFAQPCEPLAGLRAHHRRERRRRPGAVALPGAVRPAAVGVADADWAALRARAVAAVRDSVAPAYRALLAFYRAEYAPRCRPTAGVSATPDGAAYYAFRVRRETTTDLTPAQVHALGLAEVARVGRLMDSVAAAAGSADRRAYVARLRTDPRYYARSADELLAAAATVAKRLDGEMPRLFGRLPRLPYTVRPVPAAVAEGTTTAYYGPGSLEGGRPGVYWVNTSRLDQRPLYELPALTMHEAVPGHHQQIALAQELDLPPFRRHGAAFAAFTEGWGLYSERLGESFGLYDTPERMMGRLSYEMWRACRLVVDTGLHAYGWTRARAVAYMLANTALSPANVDAEVNRYITWPGQATAYKVGELRIRALRERAERELGARFDQRAFHDAVLELGPVPLDVLEAHVGAWIARAAPAGAGRGR